MHCCYCLQDALQMSNKICRKYERLDDTYVVPISHTRYQLFWGDFCLAPLVVNYWIKPLCIKGFWDLPTAACCSLQWVFCVGFSRPVTVLCRFLHLLNCVPEDLACPFYALLISVSIHSECDSFVSVSQLF